MISTFNFKKELEYKITLITFKSDLTTAYRINSTVKYKYKAIALYVNRFYANSDIFKIYLFIYFGTGGDCGIYHAQYVVPYLQSSCS
jgi:hypothetical protein